MIKGYKTLIFAALLAAFGALQIGLPAVQKFIDPTWYGWITIAVAVIVAVLRVFTSSSIFQGGSSP